MPTKTTTKGKAQPISADQELALVSVCKALAAQNGTTADSAEKILKVLKFMISMANEVICHETLIEKLSK